MDWYKSQLISTAVLAVWNIGVLFALSTGLMGLLIMRSLGIDGPVGSEASVVTVMSIAVGVVAAGLVGWRLMPALQRLSRIWGTVVFMALVLATFAFMPEELTALVHG